jgi:hypothetical protein
MTTAKLYTKFPANALGGETSGESGALDYLSDAIRVSLHTSAYTPNQDTHEFFSDLTNEITGTGYTAEGALLTSKTITVDGPTNKVVFGAANTLWTSATFTLRYAVVYRDTGTPSTSLLIGYVDFVTDQSVVDGSFEIAWDTTNGVFYSVVTP